MVIILSGWHALVRIFQTCRFEPLSETVTASAPLVSFTHQQQNKVTTHCSRCSVYTRALYDLSILYFFVNHTVLSVFVITGKCLAFSDFLIRVANPPPRLFAEAFTTVDTLAAAPGIADVLATCVILAAVAVAKTPPRSNNALPLGDTIRAPMPDTALAAAPEVFAPTLASDNSFPFRNEDAPSLMHFRHRCRR